MVFSDEGMRHSQNITLHLLHSLLSRRLFMNHICTYTFVRECGGGLKKKMKMACKQKCILLRKEVSFISIKTANLGRGGLTTAAMF